MSQMPLSFHGCLGHQVIEELNDYADKNFIPKQDMEVSRKYTDGSGRPRVCGGRNLKQTQAYPKRP